MGYRVTEVRQQSAKHAFDVEVTSASEALGLLEACRQAFGGATVRDASGRIVDVQTLVDLAERETQRESEKDAA